MKSLLIGMVIFDLFLHIWQFVTGEYFVIWSHYNLFWTCYWIIFLICLIYEFRKEDINKWI